MELPILLALNMFDEANARGIDLDVSEVQNQLGLPVMSTIAVRGAGVDRLVDQLKQIICDATKVGAVNPQSLPSQ